MEAAFLQSLAEKYGSPLYVYDSAKIISQYQRITNPFSGVKNLKVHFPTKPLSNINILKLRSKTSLVSN